jgi:CRISPR-associated protein Cas2
LHRALKRYAIPIQYSVFHAELGEAALASVVALIERTIDPAQDDVRIYRLPAGGWAQSLGVSPLPPGIGYVSLPQTFRSVPAHDGEGAPGPATDARTGGGDPESDPEGAGAGPVSRARDGRPGAGGPRLSRRMRKRAQEIQARIQTGIRSGFQVV